MLVPNLLSGKLVYTDGERAGEIVEEWEVAFSQLFTQLQTNFSNEGLVTPSQPSATPDNFSIIQPRALTGTLLFDTTNDALNVKLEDGLFHPIQIGGLAVLTIDGTPGDISASRVGQVVTLDLINTAVTPASYTYASFTVDDKGRITAASSGVSPITSILGTANQIDVNTVSGVSTISITTNPTLPGNVTTTGDLTISGNLNPSTDGNSNMGAPGLNWGSAYIDIMHIDNQMFLSDYPGTPSPPPSGFSQIYSAVNGVTGYSQPFYQDEGGNIYPWSTASGTVTSITAGNSIVCTPNPIVGIGSIDTIQDIRTSASPTFSGLTASSTGGIKISVISTTTGGSNLADLYLTRGDVANGYNRIVYATGVTNNWSVGQRPTDNIYRIFDEMAATTRLTIDTSGNVNIANLAASQAVVTDSSKNLASLAYASANTASTLVERDGSGNFSAGTITASLTGTASNAAAVTTTSQSLNISFYPVWVSGLGSAGTSLYGNTNLSFNPSTATFTTTNYIGSSLFAGGSSGGTLTIGGGTSSTLPNNQLAFFSSGSPGITNSYGNLLVSSILGGNQIGSTTHVISYASSFTGSTSSSIELETDGSSNPTLGFGTGSASLKYISGIFQTTVPIVAIRKPVTSSTYTTLATDYIVGVNFAGAVTITLYASPVVGQTYVVVDESGAANTNNITVTASAGINGGTSLLIQQSYGSISFYYNGTQWFTC